MIRILYFIFVILQLHALANNQIQLSEEETLWLKNHPIIKVGVSGDYAPYEFMDEDLKLKGIAVNYLKEMEKILGVEFKLITAKTWEEITTMAKTKEVDMLSCLVKSNKRAKYLNFTKPYISFPMAIVTNKTIGYINGLKELDGKPVAVINTYITSQLLEEKHKHINLVKTKDMETALKLVSSGKTFAYVGNLSQIIYSLQKGGFQNLAVAGIGKYKFEYTMGIVKGNPVLKSIIQKAINAIPKKIKNSIYSKWFPPLVKYYKQSEMLIKVVAFSVFIILVFLFWIYRLKKDIRKNEQIEVQYKKDKEWLSSSLHSANIAAWNLDLKKGTIKGGSVFVNILGLEGVEVILDMDYFQKKFVHKEDLHIMLKQEEKCFNKSENLCSSKFRIITKSGKIKTVISSATIFEYDTYNNPIRMIGYFKEL